MKINVNKKSPMLCECATARIFLVVLDNKQKSPTRLNWLGIFYVKEIILIRLYSNIFQKEIAKQRNINQYIRIVI